MASDADPDPDTGSDPDPLEELASLSTLAHPTASPDGDRVAYYHDVTGRNELHVLDVETGERERWSDGEVPRDTRWFVRWDADGERVFFHDDGAGDEQNDVYAIDSTGVVEPVVETDGQNVLQDVDPDGTFVVVGSTRDGQMNCYRHDLADGSVTQLTDYDRAVWGSVLSPDGDRIAYATNETDEYENVDVYVASVESLVADGPGGGDGDASAARNLEIGEVGAEASPVDWSPDGDRLLVADNSTDLTRCGVYDLEADSVRWLGKLAYEEQPECFCEDGDVVVATRARDATAVPVVYDLEFGDGRELDSPRASPTSGWPAGPSSMRSGCS